MKTIRALSVAALALAISAAPALAQGGPPPGAGPAMRGGHMGRAHGGPQRRMRWLLQGITLTPAQQAQVDTINAQFLASRPAMTPGVRPDSATVAMMRARSAAHQSAVRALLTPDQQTVWDRNLEQMRARWAARRP